jgi:hypothetical protein
MVLHPVPQKFNTFNTFTPLPPLAAIATFAIFAKFANFNLALEYPTLLPRQVPSARSISERTLATRRPLSCKRLDGPGTLWVAVGDEGTRAARGVEGFRGQGVRARPTPASS